MTSTAHDDPGGGDPAAPRVQRLAERVYAFVQPDGGWWINNTGFVVGREAVVYIDTCATEQRTRVLVEAVEAAARPYAAPGRAPACIVVNTHHHGDHTNGNCIVPGATVVAHDGCRQAVQAFGILRPEGIWEPVAWGELEPAAPFVTFEDRLNVYVDDLRIELRHFGTAAHTTNDVVAWIPDHGIVFTGDLVFNGGTPFVLMGSVAGSLVALDCVAQLDAAVLVPGHGDVCGVEAVDVTGEYLRFLQETASDAVRLGMTPLEAARRTDLGPFAGLQHPERLVGNLHRAMAECAGARPGEPLDIVAALGDMVAFNGGRPLACSA